MPPRKRPIYLDAALSNLLFVLLVVATGFALIWDGVSVPLVTYAAFTDYWEHTAALTEWMGNLAAPGNPHVVSDDLSSRYMPYFWLLSLLGQTLGLTAVQLMSISLVINFCLIVLGIKLFFRHYFGDLWAPLVGFIAIFMFWGVGWNWSNLYQLRSFFYVGGYPSAFVFGLSLISFWTALKFLRQEGSPIVLGASMAFLSVMMLLCHPLTAVFGLTGCALLAVIEKTAPAAVRVSLLGVMLAGAIAAELWPYFSVWKLMLGQYGAGIEQWPSLRNIDPGERFSSAGWWHMFYNPGLMVVMLGPALLGIPIIFYLWLKREHRFIVWGTFLMAAPYLVNLFLPVPLAHRFLLFVVFYLHLALVWFLLTLMTVCRTEPRPAYGKPVIWAMTVLMFAVIGGNASLLAGEFRGGSLTPDNFQVRDKTALLPEGQNVIDLYEQLTAPLTDNAVVLTTASLGWPLPTVKGKVVSLYHENPVLLDQLDRYQATADFFYRPIDDTKRAEIVTRYAASHVLLSDRDQEIKPAVSDWLNQYGQLVASVANYRMYRLLDTIPRVMPEPVVVEPEAPEPAPVSDAQPMSASPNIVEAPGEPESLPDTLPSDVNGEAAPARSFGAPIAAPILNLPEEEPADVVGTFDEPVEAEQEFGAPIAEGTLPESDGSPLPAAPKDLGSD